eukprot:SAG31_NODE_5362_length_2587_cov_2.129823_1_plen_661_part_10
MNDARQIATVRVGSAWALVLPLVLAHLCLPLGQAQLADLDQPSLEKKAKRKPDEVFHVLDPANFSSLLQEDLEWATASIPFFDSSDANLTAVYYFRWRVFKRHAIRVANGTDTDWVITEFTPHVGWAGKDNSIICAAGHHLIDARWLRDGATASSAGQVADSYSAWWTTNLAGVRYNYYGWIATAILERLKVAGDIRFLSLVKRLLPGLQDLVAKYSNGSLPGSHAGSFFDHDNDCVWNWPNDAGQEHNPAGGGCQPLTNAMMYSEAASLSQLCELAGDAACAASFGQSAKAFRKRVYRLWNPQIEAFDTLASPQPKNDEPARAHSMGHSALPADAAAATPFSPPFAGVRELSSLSSPWYFGAVDPADAAKYAAGWKTAFDPDGLSGQYGLRTAEKRLDPKANHMRQKYPYSCYSHSCCYWGGPVWPFETAKALTAAANVLHDASMASAVRSAGLTRAGLWMLFEQYTAMHSAPWTITNFTDGAKADYDQLNGSGYFLTGFGLEPDSRHPAMWIAEAGCADDATWTDNPSGGYWYEHSTFMDIVVRVVAGLVPNAMGPRPTLRVQPLLPNDTTLDYFALDAALIGGRVRPSSAFLCFSVYTLWHEVATQGDRFESARECRPHNLSRHVGQVVSVVWDAQGTKYGYGKGLTVLVDGLVAAKV